MRLIPRFFSVCGFGVCLLTRNLALAAAGADPAGPTSDSPGSSGQSLWLQPGVGSDIAVPGVPAPRSADGPQMVPIPPVSGHVVRVAYIIPSNRTGQTNAIAHLQTVMLHYQDWYRDQMERNGFGPKTFRLETEADGKTPIIYAVPVTETDAYLRGDLWGRTITAAANAGVPVWTARQVWFLISEAHLQNADGSVTGGTALGASWGSGDDAGVGMLGGDSLARFNPALFTNDLAYNNRLLPAMGPYPLKQDVSFPWFEGTTFSSVASSALGAGIHETSHGFGLPHDFRNDQNFKGNLMGNGLRGLRGALFPARYPADYTRAGYGSALVLNVSRYFNSGRTYTDNTKPSLTVSTRGTNSPVNGLLNISFSATDASGLSAALLQLNGDAVDEMPLSGTSVTRNFATSYYTPGQTNKFTVSVWDSQGNKQWVETSVVPQTGFNRAPQPFVTISPPTALVGQNVVLDASGSSDPGGSLGTVAVEWDLDGDGAFGTPPTFLKVLSTNFPSAGDRLVQCRLTDNAGAQSLSAPLAVRVLAPTLAIARSGAAVTVSWPANAGGFNLYSASAIPAAGWQATTQALTIVNGQKTLTVTNTSDEQFFRLER